MIAIIWCINMNTPILPYLCWALYLCTCFIAQPWQSSHKLMVVGDHMDCEMTVRLEITVVLFTVIQQYQISTIFFRLLVHKCRHSKDPHQWISNVHVAMETAGSVSCIPNFMLGGVWYSCTTTCRPEVCIPTTSPTPECGWYACANWPWLMNLTRCMQDMLPADMT